MTSTPPPAAPSRGLLSRLVAARARWRNTAYSAVDHLWLLLLWAVSTPIFIATLGESDFGVWILINAVIGLNGVISFGFGEATTRFVAQYRARGDATRMRRVTESSALMFVLASAGFAAGIWTSSGWIAATVFDLRGEAAVPSIIALRLAACALVVSAFLKTWESAINGCERFDVTARISMVTRSFIIASNVALAVLGFGLPALLSMVLMGLSGQTVALFVIARRSFLPGLRIIGWADRMLAAEIMRYGLQSWLQICAGAMSNIVDRFMVGAMIDPAAAGVYAVCLQLAQQIHLLLYRGLGWLMPASSRDTASGADIPALIRGYRAGMILTLVIVAAVALPLFVLASQVLTVWVGETFATQGTVVLRLLLVYFAVLSIGIPGHFLVNGAGFPGWNSVATLAHGAILLSAAALLLPAFGLPGIGWARVLALPTLAISFYALHHKALSGTGHRLSLIFVLGLASILAVTAMAEYFLAGAVPVRLWAVIAAGFGLSLLGAALILLPVWAVQHHRARAIPGAK